MNTMEGVKMPDEGNGWSEYQKLVLSDLHDLKQSNKEARETMSRVGAEIAALKVKAGIWGGLAGLIPFGLYLLTKAG